jgi:mannose-6-phosphate isomerase-like protein (cupin superfamily)
MSNYTIAKVSEALDLLGDYPGEMRSLTSALGSEQVALTYRRMPHRTGGKGSYGHRHRTQEELYLVLSGRLQFKLDNAVVELDAGSAVRVAPEVVRSIWNDEAEDAELVICSTRVENVDEDAELVEDFWPD